MFRIDWDKPQTPYLLPTCVFSYIQNIGKAISQGFDMQGDFRVTPSLTFNSSVGYTDAHYTETVQTVPNAQGVRSTLVFAGQDFVGIPHWQGTLGARYAFDVFDHAAYVTGNWQYTGQDPERDAGGHERLRAGRVLRAFDELRDGARRHAVRRRRRLAVRRQPDERRRADARTR